MDNNEKYDLLAERETGLTSCMAIVPGSRDYKFETSRIENSLRKSKYFKLVSFLEVPDSAPLQYEYDSEIEYNGTIYDVKLYIDQTKNLHFDDYSFGNTISEESLQTATEQDSYLGTEMQFEENSLESFHLQLKIMHTIVPDASLCVDFMSLRLLAAPWLTMTAQSAIPPSPNYLYVIHGVYDQKEDGSTVYWFHTHGLNRCKSVELEMVNITQYPEQMHTLLNMTANRFLTDPAKEKESYMVGYDGMNIDMCWLRWEEALKDFPSEILGGMDERIQQNNIHAEPTGLLYAVQDGNMVSPEIYGKTLADNPIYYISTEETERMSDLAKERFNLYKAVFERENPKSEKQSFLGKIFKKKEQETEWSFLVKMGLAVDPSDESVASEKEHLWFKVESINEKNDITGELLNQPYWITNLNEGDVKTYPISLLTDWIIYGPEKSYTSDIIYELV